MPITQFPNPAESSSEGVILVGGDLHPETLQLAYRSGIFPWPVENYPLLWFCPPERAILEWDRLHLSRSLKQARKKHSLRFTIDQAFDQVIFECAKIPRNDQDGTWITSKLSKAYCRLHQLGHAHSVEVWQEDVLVGGLYGMDAGGAFSGESMFHKVPNASKFAILHLIEHLHSRGLDWMDIQVMTPHMEALGARLIPREEFLEKLKIRLESGSVLF